MAALPYYKPSTPPPSTIVNNPPPTPRLGAFEDDWQPYGSFRKSTRSSNNSVAQAPPLPTPRKKTPRDSLNMGGRKVSGTLTTNSMATAAEALGITSEDAMDTDLVPARNGGMMITPDKTPVKPPKKTVGIAGVARSLNFDIHGDHVMPTPKRAASKKYSNSFEGEPERPTHIYIDSQDRIPEIDDGLENPFYTGPDAIKVEPSKKKHMNKGQKVSSKESKTKAKKDEVDHEDGMYYMFRGKKVYRRFSEMDAEEVTAADSDDDHAELDDIAPHLRKPLTRSSIKPRRLWNEKSTATQSDEEASTDIEERMDVTPKRLTKKSISTPKAPKYAPYTPPTTARTTRSKDVNMDAPIDFPFTQDSSTTQDDDRKVSPFNNWKRTKNATGQAKKREGEPITRGTGESKKPRGGHGRSHA